MVCCCCAHCQRNPSGDPSAGVISRKPAAGSKQLPLTALRRDADQQRLAFVDINGERLHTYVPASGEHKSYATDEYVTSVVLSTNPDRLVVSQKHALLEIGLSSGVMHTLATAPQAKEDGWVWNDVRASPAGIIIGGRWSQIRVSPVLLDSWLHFGSCHYWLRATLAG